MATRLAYMHSSFPGLFSSFVGFISSQKLANAVFLAERWPRDIHFSGVRKVRIPGPDSQNIPRTMECQNTHGRMTYIVCNALRAGDTLLRLRKGGFVPDVIYATAGEGYLLYAKDIFPKARIVLRLGSFYNKDVLCNDAKTACMDSANAKLATIGRIQNCFTLSALNDCHLAIASSAWQRKMFDGVIGEGKIQHIPYGVDTTLFCPSREPRKEEIVTFACQGTNPARGIETICACLLDLLTKRPHCRVRLLSFAPPHAEAVLQHTEKLQALLPSDSELRNRIDIVVSPSQDAYVKLLHTSTIYVYLTAPVMLSAGILEAMSCGTLVIASDTGPVHELVRHGENGFLCTAHSPQILTSMILETLKNAPDMLAIGRAARETILEGHDLRKLLPLHAALALGHSRTNFF